MQCVVGKVPQYVIRVLVVIELLLSLVKFFLRVGSGFQDIIQLWGWGFRVSGYTVAEFRVRGCFRFRFKDSEGLCFDNPGRV